MGKVKVFLQKNDLEIIDEAYKNRENYDFMERIGTIDEYYTYMDNELSLLEYCSQQVDFTDVSDFLDFVDCVHNDISLVAKVVNINKESFTVSEDGYFSIFGKDRKTVYIYHAKIH